MKNYERAPILISPHCIALIMLYEKCDDLMDISIGAWEHWINDEERYKKAAQQFVNQLEDRWCPAFLEALRDEINAVLEATMKERA